MAAQIDGQKLVKVAEQIDRYVYDEALALFLCAPQALYAVNKHVNFGPYRTTFELAETEVHEQNWSRSSMKEGQQSAQATPASSSKGSASFSGGSAADGRVTTLNRRARVGGGGQVVELDVLNT